MTIEKKRSGSCAELILQGWLDTQSVPVLSEALDSLEDTVDHLVLDLAGLEYTSSAGIRQFISAHKKMKGELTLRHVSTEVMDVLKMTGLDKRLHIEA